MDKLVRCRHSVRMEDGKLTGSRECPNCGRFMVAKSSRSTIFVEENDYSTESSKMSICKSCGTWYASRKVLGSIESAAGRVNYLRNAG